MIPRAERSHALAQLAALAARGVPLPEALAAIREELSPRSAVLLDPGLAAAREGAPLARVVADAGLVGPRDRALLEAARGDEAARTLALVAEEEAARTRRDELVRRLLSRPLLKVVLLLLLGLVLIWALAATGQYLRVIADDMPAPPELVLARPMARVVVGTLLALGGFLVLVVGFRAIGRSRHGRRF
ncbi:MAG TPA: hypothetical protein VFF73_32705, partial [Planctomycetota bacterium]|nr:hypothetical protein [Planctomycetota bacterium]